MSNETNILPALRQENVQMIVKDAPEVYNKNLTLSRKCAIAGEKLLASISQFGMTDALDMECAEFMEKTKKALGILNKRRSPFTKLFDQVRSEFTSMENAIDPGKKDSIPNRIQQARNAFAAKKRAEEEAKRREELRRQQREQSLSKYRRDVEDDIRSQFDRLVNTDINYLTSLNRDVTLENYTETVMKLQKVSVSLGDDWFSSLQTFAHRPYEISESEAMQIRNEVIGLIAPDLKAQYKHEIGEYRDTLSDNLPSKYRELERMAKADAEEQARMKAELEAKESAGLRRLEEERRNREQKEEAEKKIREEAAEMGGLFNQAMVAAPAGYTPKTSVKFRITPLNQQAFLDIVGMWWGREGQFLQIDELEKIFKKQVTAVEKYANDKESPEFITTPNVRYDEEVKAK